MNLATFCSLTQIEERSCRERFCRDGADPIDERAVREPTFYVERAPIGAGRLFEVLKTLLRWAAKGLYLFPLLLLVKAALHIAHRPSGDLITLAFVGLVVLFFTLLALLLLCYPLVGPRSKRRSRLKLVLPDSGDWGRALREASLETLETSPEEKLAAILLPGEASGGAFRLRGTAAPAASAGVADRLVLDAWRERDGSLHRLFLAEPLVLHAESAPPVIVRFESAPLLVAAYREETAPSLDLVPQELRQLWIGADAELDQASPVTAAELRAGDELEVVGASSSLVRSQELMARGGAVQLGRSAEASDPYRGDGGTRYLVLTSTPDAPLIIRRARPAGYRL